MPAAGVDRSLVIRHLRKEYRAGQPVLRDVSMTVAGRGMTCIIGPSGTGKSTLAMHLAVALLNRGLRVATIDLDAGTDTLALATGGNTVTVSNAESIAGGSGTDIVTLGNAGTLTVTAVETLIGSSGNDTVTLGAAVTAMSVVAMPA